MDISEDKKTYTFRLREAKWSDEEPVKAQDFEYAWKRALNPKTKGEYAYILYPIKNAEAYNTGQVSADEVGIKAVDEQTLQVELDTGSVFSQFDYLCHLYAAAEGYCGKIRRKVWDGAGQDGFQRSLQSESMAA